MATTMTSTGTAWDEMRDFTQVRSTRDGELASHIEHGT
jgi:hypothetical protein